MKHALGGRWFKKVYGVACLPHLWSEGNLLDLCYGEVVSPMQAGSTSPLYELYNMQGHVLVHREAKGSLTRLYSVRGC